MFMMARKTRSTMTAPEARSAKARYLAAGLDSMLIGSLSMGGCTQRSETETARCSAEVDPEDNLSRDDAIVVLRGRCRRVEMMPFLSERMMMALS